MPAGSPDCLAGLTFVISGTLDRYLYIFFYFFLNLEVSACLIHDCESVVMSDRGLSLKFSIHLYFQLLYAAYAISLTLH